MSTIIDICSLSITTGLIYSLAVLGFALSLRMLAYPDLTLEGSFVLGGVVSAVCLKHGFPPVLTIPIALLAGAAAGLFTAFIHCYCRVGKLLSGLIALAVLYTLNLRILGGPNQSFYQQQTLFSFLPDGISPLLIIIPGVGLFFLGVRFLLGTEFGLYLRACGENGAVVRKAGYDKRLFVLVGLAISNSLISLSGSLFCQYSGFSDVSIGGGLIVVALTSLILGEVILRPRRATSFLFAIALGACLCQAIAIGCLHLQLHPADYKGVVGLLLVGLVFARSYVNKRGSGHVYGSEIF